MRSWSLLSLPTVWAQPWGSLAYTSACSFSKLPGQNFLHPGPTLCLCLARPGTRGLAGPLSDGQARLCASQLYVTLGSGPVALAGRAPSVPGNHPAGRTRSRQRPGETLQGTALRLWRAPGVLAFLPLPALQLQRVAGGSHVLHPPDGSRVRCSPAQTPGSPEDLTQHLEKGPSLRAGGDGAGGWLRGREGGCHHPGKGSWRERETAGLFSSETRAWAGERFRCEHGHASRP